MWIATDKDGRTNGFFFKPERMKSGCRLIREERWANDTFPPLWTDIPEDYLESLGIRVNEWPSEPIEIQISNNNLKHTI